MGCCYWSDHQSSSCRPFLLRSCLSSGLYSNAVSGSIARPEGDVTIFEENFNHLCHLYYMKCWVIQHKRISNLFFLSSWELRCYRSCNSFITEKCLIRPASRFQMSNVGIWSLLTILCIYFCWHAEWCTTDKETENGCLCLQTLTISMISRSVCLSLELEHETTLNPTDKHSVTLPAPSYASAILTVPPIEKWTILGLSQGLIISGVQFSQRINKTQLYDLYFLQSANPCPKSTSDTKAANRASKALRASHSSSDSPRVSGTVAGLQQAWDEPSRLHSYKCEPPPHPPTPIIIHMSPDSICWNETWRNPVVLWPV